MWHCQEADKDDDTVVYVSNEVNKTFYYNIDGDKISGNYLNQNGSEILANSTLHEKSYDSYGNVQKNAEALYWQSVDLSVTDTEDPFCDYFIIRVKWNDKVQNNKETDMVYLTVQRK